MKRLIARNIVNTKTGIYEGFSEQYLQEVLEKKTSHQGKKPMEDTREPQDLLGIIGSEAISTTGPHGLPFKAHNTFHSSQYARLQVCRRLWEIFPLMNRCNNR
jgi:hypothetical protein